MSKDRETERQITNIIMVMEFDIFELFIIKFSLCYTFIHLRKNNFLFSTTNKRIKANAVRKLEEIAFAIYAYSTL
jgi:hypothetical protein